VAESLVEAFRSERLQGRRILLPRAAVARDVIPTELEKLGAQVEVVEAYRNVIPENAGARAHEIFSGSKKPDWITFTSSSTVQNCIEVAGADALRGIRIASIGPVTSETVRQLGFTVDVEAKQFTIDGLVQAILTAS
jgi:uroporphyrinogen III methyltransferase/synthase